MVRFTFLNILIAIFLLLVVTTITINGEGQTPETRSKVRSKLSSAVRKKKTNAVRTKLELTSSTSTTTTVIPSNVELEEIHIQGVEGSTEGQSLKELGGAAEPEPNTTDISLISLSTPKTPFRITTRKVSRTNSPQSIPPNPEGCGDCDKEDCNTPPDTSCPNGLVFDRCGCCYVCGALEGNRCFNSTLNLPYNPDGICGPHLDCLLREDLDPNEPREALCECRDKRIVCGSDHKTYNSECKLREAAHSKPGLIVKTWNPCLTAPEITTPVENMTVAIGLDVSLSCEVRAYPAPILHWEFLAEGKRIDDPTSVPQILPGDDSGIVVVVRGGSEYAMTTSWIQIIDVSPKRQGIYICVAKNSEGIIRTPAEVRVYKSLDDE